MPYAVAHFIFAFLLVELLKNFILIRGEFPKHYIIYILIGALLPDLDVLVYFLIRHLGFSLYEIHRAVLHNIFVPIIILIVALWTRKNRKNISNILMIISIAVFSHLILDMLISGKIELFFPISNLKVGLNLLGLFPEDLQNMILPIIDAGLFILFILWMDLKKKLFNFSF